MENKNKVFAFMSYTQNEYIKKHVNAAQIMNTIRTSRFFIGSILMVTLYVYCIYQFYFNKPSSYFNLWFVITILFCSFTLLINTFYMKPQKFSLNYIHRWLQIQILCAGICSAVGIALLFYYLPAYNKNFSYIDGLVLSALFIIVSQASALTFLTKRLDYFCFAFIPAIFPYFISQFAPIETSNYIFHLSINFALIIVLLCAKIASLIHQHILMLNYDNKRLAKNAEQQVFQAQELYQELKIQINKSKDIEHQLKLHNQYLEQTIEDRTTDIAKMNLDLENQQHSLMLAHEIAGLRHWNWNIKGREILITDHKQEKILKSTKKQEYELQNIPHPNDIQNIQNSLKQHLRGRTELYEATYRIQDPLGDWKWVHDIGKVISRDLKTQKPLRMLGIRRDIHQERTNQEHLKLVASVVQQAAEGIFILDEKLCYLQANPFYKKITGFSDHEIIGKRLFDITKNTKSQQRMHHSSILNQLLKTGEFEGELNEKFTSGKDLILWMHVNAVTNEQNHITHYIGIVSDLTERKLQEQRLSYLENYDPLTDLPNRFYYNYQLHQYLMGQNESFKQLAIIRLNIDRFRPLNEFLSNSGGDELLRQVAQRLRLSNVDALFLAHLNADDFVVVYEISHIRPSIQQHCDKITAAFSCPFKIFDQDHIITVSLGVAFYPEHGRQLDYLNNCAEQALSEAKSLGGNTICYYTHNNSVLLEQGIYLERDLRHAINNNEMVVYYQPKISFSDQHIYGFEALVRWQHPTKGIIPPDLFIPLAEQTSLISDIGKIVLEQTAKQIRQWNDSGFNQLCVSVNVVAQQLQRGELLQSLDFVIKEYGILGSSLELEITESSLLENSTAIKNLLHEIKKRDIHISLDDFGTGYSSLSYLAEFPIDTLKIDRSFISKIGENKQQAIVSAMIAMGKAMGLLVVAEGIETEKQLQYLQELDCDIAQGYLFSKPLPENEATLFLERHRLISL